MELNITNIYDDHYNRVLAVINAKVRNIETAEDLAAEVFVKIHQKIETFDSEKATLSTWIGSVTKNLVIDYFRKRKLNSKPMTDLSDDEGKEMIVYSNYITPETELINNQLGESILDAMCSLPETQMTVIDLFLNEQKSHEEICSTLSMPIGTVKATIHRAKEALRSKLINL